MEFEAKEPVNRVLAALGGILKDPMTGDATVVTDR
jgi:hypothetical protein